MAADRIQPPLNRNEKPHDDPRRERRLAGGVDEDADRQHELNALDAFEVPQVSLERFHKSPAEVGVDAMHGESVVAGKGR